VGWNHWKAYTRFIQSSPFLDVIPEAFDCQDSVGPDSSFPVTAALGFLAYLTDPDFGISVQPSTAVKYWSAARYFLQISRQVDIAQLDLSPALAAARAGLRNRWQESEEHLLDASRTLPFTLDFIFQSGSFPYPRASPSFQLALVASMCIGYTFLCRVGEYLHTGERSKHHLLSKNAWFLVRKSSESREILVHSHKAYSASPSEVTAFVINIRTAKNDQGGEGARYVLRKSSSSAAARIVDKLFLHASLSRPPFDAPFFSSSSEGWTLTSLVLNKYLKSLARSFSLDQSRISTHSLRIAGASVLYNAGVEDSIIMKMGRWRSLAFLEYLRDASPSHDIAFSALLGPNALSTRGVL
jgi:hypothetical protein